MNYDVKKNTILNVVDHIPFDYSCECPICANVISRGPGANNFICIVCGQKLYAPEISISDEEFNDPDYKMMFNYMKDKLDDIDRRVNKVLEILNKST